MIESMRHWLTISGGGSWSAGKRYVGSGPHEVDEQTAAAAGASGLPWLSVSRSDVEPDPIPDEQPSGTLVPTDFDHASEPDPPDAEPAEGGTAHEVGSDGRIACPRGCGKDYASEPALERHLQVVHGEVTG